MKKTVIILLTLAAIFGPAGCSTDSDDDGDVTLESIAVTTQPTKTTYTVGEELDLTGLVVTGTYSDGTTKTETVTAANVTGFDSSAAAATQTLTITIGGKTATFTVTITEGTGGEATLSSIAVTTPPSKITYAVNEELDLTGLVVTGTYSDGTTKTETVTVANVTGFDSSAAAASQTLTVTVGGKTATFTITIVDPFTAGTPSVVENTIVHENPEITAAIDPSKVTISKVDGSATLSGGGFSYAFPSSELSLDWKDCTTIKIDYTLSGTTDNHAQVIIKDGVNSTTDIGTESNEKYPWLTSGTSITLPITYFPNSVAGKNAEEEAVTPGFTFQYNSGNESDVFTVKITKITFTKIDETVEDYTVDLTDKTVKNAEAWTSNYSGFVIALNLPENFPFASYSKLTVKAKTFDSENTEHTPDWTNYKGQAMLIADASDGWSGDNVLMSAKYNLGVGTISTTGEAIELTAIPGGLVVQNSDAATAYIEITEITFHN